MKRPDKSTETTPVGAFCSAVAVRVASRQWRSFFRQPSMRLTHILPLSLGLAVASCSRSSTPVPPVTEEPPTHGIQRLRFTIGTDNLTKTNVLAAVAAFADEHSLPAYGRTQAKIWPIETYGFGYLPCYTNVNVVVGFCDPAPQAIVELMYYGTNDSFYDGFRLALRQNIESNFTGRVISVSTN
jgi:hypothetical protein